jgi:hypothetical protein
MSSEVPIEIEDKPTAVDIMRELVEPLQRNRPVRRGAMGRFQSD